MPIVFSMKIRNFSKVTLLKVTQFLSLSKVSLLKFLENSQKIFKSDTFENYKSFVPVEVQSLCRYVLVNTIRAVYLHAYT